MTKTKLLLAVDEKSNNAVSEIDEINFLVQFLEFALTNNEVKNTYNIINSIKVQFCCLIFKALSTRLIIVD